MPDPNLPEGAVVITTADIYRQLLDLTKQVGELKGAVSVAADHELRLRALERGRWPLPALAIAVSIASLIAMIIVTK